MIVCLIALVAILFLIYMNEFNCNFKGVELIIFWGLLMLFSYFKFNINGYSYIIPLIILLGIYYFIRLLKNKKYINWYLIVMQLILSIATLNHYMVYEEKTCVGWCTSSLGLFFIFLAIILYMLIINIITLVIRKRSKTVIENTTDITSKHSVFKTVFIAIVIVAVITICYISFISVSQSPTRSSEISYIITYYDEMIPGSKSDIQIYSDKVEITTTNFCSAVDCTPSTEKRTFNYSNANINKLITFIKTNFGEENIELYNHKLTDKQSEAIEGLLLGEYFFEINVEEYEYKIGYLKDDSLSYNIYLKKDNSVLIKKITIDTDYKITEVDTYKLDFSKENLMLIGDYIKKEAQKENSNSIYKSTLRQDEIKIFNSIIENNEMYLDTIEDEVNLSYTISYNGVNCPTPMLYLYSNNTYEFYYTYSTDNNKLIPKTGMYNYDVVKIIENIDKYSEDKAGPYYITDESGKQYITYSTNVELRELLSSLDLKLEKCLEQQ